MLDAPLALAFTAGLVATLNPCGFVLLPAYLSYFLGQTDEATAQGSAAAAARALAVGGVVSLGFLGVFGVAGLLITLGLRAVIAVVPWLALLVGVGVVVLGIGLLAGRDLTARLPKLAWRGDAGTRSMFVFGVSYAIASLSCTLPVFLTVVAGAATRTSVLGGVVTFLAYGAGMALLLVAVTVAVALGKGTLLRRLRAAGAGLGRVAGGLLVLAGGYVVWYWATNLASGAGAAAASAPVAFVETLSSRATTLVGTRPLAWSVALAAVIVAALLAALARTRRSPEPAARDREPAG